MGRIKDTNKYPIKTNPIPTDYVIGSDSENNGKTVNFPVSAFSGDGGVSLQNNRFKVTKVGNAVTSVDVANAINNLSVPLTVLEDEIPLFYFLRPAQLGETYPRVQTWGLTGLGKGVYGIGGDTLVTSSNPFVIEEQIIDVSFTPDDYLNAVVIDLGEVADGNIINAINISSDQYVIEAGTNWFFEATFGGSRVLYGFQGANGTYGNGGTTIVESDLFLIVDETNPPIITPSGLELITEGANTGWRLIGLDPANHGNIGASAIDFTSNGIAGTFGATGALSVAFGQRTTASGYASFTHGYDVTASGLFNVGIGYQISTSGYASFTVGYNNTENSSTGYAFTAGQNNINRTNAGFMSGVALESTGGVGTAILGVANDIVAGAGNGTSPTQPIIVVGNGTHTTPVGSPWSAVSRSNLLVGLRNGTFILPSTTIAVIDAEATGRQVVTKEWVLSQGFGGVLQSLNEGSGVGYVISGRTAANYGDVGLRAFDFSYSSAPSGSLGATGTNSVAFGLGTTASSLASAAFGQDTQAIGQYAFTSGIGTMARGSGSFATGNFTTASLDFAFAINSSTVAAKRFSFAQGSESIADGEGSVAMNFNNRARSYGEVSIGTFGTDYVANSDSSFNSSDRLFNIGVGTSDVNRKDALTVLKNAQTGLGYNNFEAVTTGEMLQVNGKVKASDLKIIGLPVYADDVAAGTGGLVTGDVYRTVTGELRIKL